MAPSQKPQDKSTSSTTTTHTSLHDNTTANVDDNLCGTCIEFVKQNSTAVDHAFPFASIKENINDLTLLINQQPLFREELEKALSGYQQLNNNLPNPYYQSQDALQAYFLFNKTEKKYEPNLSLAHLCYNNISNLWLLCNGCNLDKSSKEVIKWLQGQIIFGADFQTAIKEAGECHQGLIFDKIGFDKDKANQMESATFTITKDGKSITKTIVAGGKGIGEFAHEWFLKNRCEIVPNAAALHENKQAFKQAMVDLSELKQTNTELAKQGFKDICMVTRMMTTLMTNVVEDKNNPTSASLEEAGEKSSSHSSDKSDARKEMEAGIAKFAKEMHQGIYLKIKLIRQLGENNLLSDEQRKIISETLDISKYHPSIIIATSGQFKEFIKNKKSITNTQIKEFLSTRLLANQGTQSEIDQKIAKELAQMRQAKEEAEQKAIEESRARQALEAENAALRRQLAAVIAVAEEPISMNSKKRELDAIVTDKLVDHTVLPNSSGLFTAAAPLKKARASSPEIPSSDLQKKNKDTDFSK